jgi:hypothetical protein
MANRAGIAGGHEEVVQDKVYGLHVTRRAFGEFVAGGLATVGLGGIRVARGQSVTTTAEPDGPDHLPRRRIKVLDTEVSYIDTSRTPPA